MPIKQKKGSHMSEIISSPSSTDQELIARQTVDSALTVHSSLGPGFLESVYEHCLAAELESRSIPIRLQVVVPIVYRRIHIDTGFRIDILAGGTVVIKIKAVEKILQVHEAQLLTYLKLSGHPLGFLVNFNAALIRQGIKRFIM